jgi:hypothetical protein
MMAVARLHDLTSGGASVYLGDGVREQPLACRTYLVAATCAAGKDPILSSSDALSARPPCFADAHA